MLMGVQRMNRKHQKTKDSGRTKCSFRIFKMKCNNQRIFQFNQAKYKFLQTDNDIKESPQRI